MKPLPQADRPENRPAGKLQGRVAIITADGKVALRGPVESDQERETIGRIAQEVAGAGNVENHLEVTSADVSKNTSKTGPQPR